MYDANILKLLTASGFDEWFYNACKDYKSNEEAYESVERNCIRYFGKRMYSNYASYKRAKNARCQRLKNIITED